MITRLLAAHRPVDPTEAEHLDQIQRFVAASPDPTDRRQFQPGHLTASAFVEDGSFVALVHHAKLDRWVQPGGHLEPSDPDPESAARREVAEEVGLDALEPLGLLDVDVHLIPGTGGEPEHRHFDLRFRFRSVRHPLTAGPGVLEARWVPFRRLLSLEESLARPARKLTGLSPGGSPGRG